VTFYEVVKSDRANISGREEAALSLAAESFLAATDRQVDELLTSGSIWEVQHYE
jgi:hypothetical protein